MTGITKNPTVAAQPFKLYDSCAKKTVTVQPCAIHILPVCLHIIIAFVVLVYSICFTRAHQEHMELQQFSMINRWVNANLFKKLYKVMLIYQYCQNDAVLQLRLIINPRNNPISRVELTLTGESSSVCYLIQTSGKICIMLAHSSIK